ncbi:PilZ domain-containing protein [Geodermatophilus sp. URMC 64]
MSEHDANRPVETSQADVTLVTRGITVTAVVDVSNEFGLVVRPAGEHAAWQTSVSTGDPVEVFWVAGNEERTLPAKMVEVEDGEEPRWHLAPTGPAERSQRRKAVRARLELPVVMPWLDSQLTGSTVDLSEAGMRALMDGWGLPPQAGTRVAFTISLENTFVDLHGDIVWVTARGPKWLMAVQFQDVAERDGDVLRKRVFEALRAERALAAR